MSGDGLERRKPVVLAVMQNQWVRDPDHLRRILDRHDAAFRRQMIARLLFMGCVSGKRLKAAFGSEIINKIVWEEASPVITGSPREAPPADVDHLARVIEELKPDLVLTFGRIATNGVLTALGRRLCEREERSGFPILSAPHPASRNPDALASALGMMAQELRGRFAP